MREKRSKMMSKLPYTNALDPDPVGVGRDVDDAGEVRDDVPEDEKWP